MRMIPTDAAQHNTLLHPWRAFVAAAAAALLVACGDRPADAPAAAPQPPAASAPAATPAAPEPQPMTATAGDALISLQPHLGRYPHDGTDYLRQGALAERLRTLLSPQEYDTLLQNLQVCGPLSQEGEVWYITGNRQHEGGAETAAIAFDPHRNLLRVWLQHAGQSQEFTDPPGAQLDWPTDVRTMQGNAGVR